VLTTFDRYLIKRYLHAFVILFVSTYGLFVVIDGFTNVDAFQEGKDSAADVLRWMGEYYGFQAIEFFDRIAAILSVIAMMVVFALLQKNSELQPILAAGVPVYRLVLPIALGAVVVNGVVICNEEFVIPRVAHRLQANRTEEKQTHSVEPRYDYKTRIHIDGKSLNLEQNVIQQAEFILPPPDLAKELTALTGDDAVYLDEADGRPAGWLLRGCPKQFEQLPLTDAGGRYVLRTSSPTELFIVSDVSIDQLSNRSRNYRYLSTVQLVRRIRNPSTGLSGIRTQRAYFHTRLVRPLLNVISVFIVIPLVLRRESRSLIVNMALCTLLLAVLYGVTLLFGYLGEKHLLAPDFAAWCPAILSAAAGAWLSDVVQT
jgi:lipopolysaccharide export system permease protein